MNYTDDVNGVVIGDITFPYEFWTIHEPFGQHRIDRNFFQNDEEAIAWFKEKYPDYFKQGIEMRVYE